ncbi:MAG: UDP-N-acetylmuramoyl-L-alanyl-D-glutamate--2,6-diaminopimelate ligase [Caulobacterales bacterium]
MKLGELFAKEWTNVAVPPGVGGLEITGLTADSRKVKPGFLFAAFQGVAAHGRDFVAQAVANGAAAVLSENDLGVEPGVPHLIAENARAEFSYAAGRFFPRKPAVRVAVTGTNGKSSTVDFLRQIWAASGKKSASMGTLGAIWSDGKIDLGHTTADPVAVHETLQQLADAGVTHVAMEASSHGLHQHRLDAVGFQGGAFLNLTQDHLDYHATMDEYRAAKMLLWNLMDHRAPAVINADSPEGAEFARVAGQRAHVVYYTGWRAPRTLSLKLVEISPRQASQDLTLWWQGDEYEVEVPLIGEFQAINATTAATLALALGETKEDVFRGMSMLKPVKGRMEHVGETPTDGHVFVDYAHTPDGLDVLLRAARPHAPGRIIVVFGCGGDRDSGKRAKMGAIAQRFADVVIVTDDNPRGEDPAMIRKQVLEGCPGAEEIGDRAAAIQSAVKRATRGDAVLIAGKGHETGQIIKGVTHPFSDQDVARAALEALT